MRNVLKGLKSVVGGRQNGVAPDDDATLREIEAHAVKIARGAGDILRGHFEHALNVEYKDDKQSDPVTNADYECQRYLQKAIAKRFPEHGILGEEDNAEERASADKQPAPDFVWVLDPLDGTRNFLSGLPLYASSIGVLYQGAPVVSAVFLPWPNYNGGIVMHAHRGGGTQVDGVPVVALTAEAPEGNRADYTAGWIRCTVQGAKGFAWQIWGTAYDGQHRLRACDGGEGCYAVHNYDCAVPMGCCGRLTACDGSRRHRSEGWSKEVAGNIAHRDGMAAAGVVRAFMEQRQHDDEGVARVAGASAAGQPGCGALCSRQPARAVNGQAAAPAACKTTALTGADMDRQDGVIARLEGVTKQYEMGDAVVYALRDVSLDIQEGQFVVLLGPSGSGKTTLLNMIGGLDVPTRGRDLGRWQRDYQHERSLADHVQAQAGWVYFSVLQPRPFTYRRGENVEMVAELTGNKRNAVPALRSVGLGDRIGHFPAQLSGGEQQRVAIARALAKGPSILLGDEPTGDLDYETGKMILGLMRRINRSENATILLVTHNVAISRMADRVIRMRSGEIVEDRAVENPIHPEDLEW